MIFGTNIPETTGHQMAVQFPTSQHLLLHYLRKTELMKYCILYKTVLLLY